MSGCGSVSGYHTLLFLLYELLDGVVLAVLIFHKALKRFFMKASTLIADGNSWMTLTHGITTFRRSGIRWCFLVWLAGVCYESLSRHGCNFHMLGSLGYRVELVVFTRAMIQVNHLSRAVRSEKSNSTRTLTWTEFTVGISILVQCSKTQLKSEGSRKLKKVARKSRFELKYENKNRNLNQLTVISTRI